MNADHAPHHDVPADHRDDREASSNLLRSIWPMGVLLAAAALLALLVLAVTTAAGAGYFK